MEKSTSTVVFNVLIGLTLILFQNCAKFDTAGLGVQSSESASRDPGSIRPPQKSIATINDWNDEFPKGDEVNDCVNDPDYNVCIIDNDPVTKNGGAFSPAFTMENSNEATETRLMTLGYKVPTTGPLTNDNFTMAGISGVRAEADSNGNWKFRYNGDSSHSLSQISTFIWLNYQVSEMKRRTGKFYFENQRLSVIAYDSGTRMNAYFNPRNIVLGYIDNGNTGKGDVALDASVTAHEAGHANLYIASNRSGINGSCRTKNGCFGGIHEGVGDVHAFLLFPNNPRTGRYFANSNNGLRAVDSIKTSNRSATYYYNLRRGEVHDMGNVYASIWYEAWVKLKAMGEERKVEELFSEHLATLGGNDTFTTALMSIETLIDQIGFQNPAAAKQVFRDEYQRMGVDIQ